MTQPTKIVIVIQPTKLNQVCVLTIIMYIV